MTIALFLRTGTPLSPDLSSLSGLIHVEITLGWSRHLASEKPRTNYASYAGQANTSILLASLRLAGGMNNPNQHATSCSHGTHTMLAHTLRGKQIFPHQSPVEKLQFTF